MIFILILRLLILVVTAISKGQERLPLRPQENISPLSPRDNRKRRRTSPRDTADPVAYGTPPKRTRKERNTSPVGRDRDYRESSRGKSSRDRDYRPSERRPRSPR